ncbi:unnamed protein product [Symbiodinium sp. CCMP2456]|nr:unnamed protein product [Symbiodinium sp. CCMP2456]
MLRLMAAFVLLSPLVALADFSCALQKRAAPSGLSVDEESTKPTQPTGPYELLEAAWSTPGVHFRQCEKPRARLLQGKRADLTNIVNGWAILPEKVQCPPSEMPIGDFVDQGLGYQFSCCKAGDQCSGCRKIENGSCVGCAAGYVKQLIPVLNVSMCFQCDNIPWHDASGLTCQDYQDRGFCPGFTKAGFDQPFQGLSPSEACCACGGGSVRSTPSLMPLAEEALYEGQSIESFPQPQAYGTTVGPECNLAEMGLHLSESGKISGHVAWSSGRQPTQIKCSVGLTQDPMRGLLNTISLEVPVTSISYGKQILLFKYWGLDGESVDRFPVQYAPIPNGWEDFRLQCSPTCPWLELQANGTLRAGLLASQLDVNQQTQLKVLVCTGFVLRKLCRSGPGTLGQQEHPWRLEDGEHSHRLYRLPEAHRFL